MLKLVNITKDYDVADSPVHALKGISIEFRKNEFVSILGQSGCGKTTLLNIIGGLDRYTSGDLIIAGRSTKEFGDRDWDTYRNHSIGFVFQSYNLIPHQTVLQNVELALTLSGISKQERKQRAVEALKKVGLENQLNKKPNQMSGGQMQRVAIARALINDPEILLADEPTGALDSETSEQIMGLLKEVADDRLVIMVTHNPELAERYSTRTVRLLDGEITDDSMPFTEEETVTEAEAISASAEKEKQKSKAKKRTSMSLFTAMSLSLNNLLTKKGRTFMTSFAGSIGIIGIALILSLSSGFQAYIDKVQEDTLSSYPITIEAESVDMSELMKTVLKANDDGDFEYQDGKVYANTDMYKMLNAYMNPEVNENDLESFKKWLESEESGVGEYTTAIQYGYANSALRVYVDSTDDGIYPANDYMSLFSGMTSEGDSAKTGGIMSQSSMMNTATVNIFQEMISKSDGTGINDLIYSQYELIGEDMKWPENKNEVILIVDKNNRIAETYLYALGLLDRDNIKDLMADMFAGKSEPEATYQTEWDINDIVGRKFKLVLPSDLYLGSDSDGDGENDRFADMSGDEAYMKLLLSSSEELTVVGIVRPKENAVATAMNGAVGYTRELTNWYVEKIAESELVEYQQAHPETDAVSGLPFKSAAVEPSDTEKAEKFKDYVNQLSEKEKAELYVSIASAPDEATLSSMMANASAGYTDRASKEGLITAAYGQQSGMDAETVKGFVENMSDEELDKMTAEVIKAMVTQSYAAEVEKKIAAVPDAQKAVMLTSTIDTLDEPALASLYDTHVPTEYSSATLQDNLKKFGYSDIAKPSRIYIFTAEFEDKDKIEELIAGYNDSVEEEKEISYTDYVALLMSSVSTIINVISYVLIAFVSISLVVSSIMIGIITYISVLERTKEIGILRSIGASKKDISRVFNAETLLVGFVAGVIGIGVTVLLNFPINLIINHFADIGTVAELPVLGGILLVIISMFLTFIAGLIPSRVAANKDPVVALRTE